MKPYKKLRVKLMEQENDIKDLASLLNKKQILSRRWNVQDNKLYKRAHKQFRYIF